MSLSDIREADVLDSLLPQYEAEGFEVFVHPSPSILPPFMQGYRPDAIAIRPDKKIAIEVIQSASKASPKLQELQSLLADHHDWELRVVYVSSLSPEQGLEIASRPAVRKAIERVRELKTAGHVVPALVMAWAALEGVGRALLPDRFRRPQTPARLVEVLASEGYLTPEEADMVRAAISVRNAAVHGVLDPAVDEQQLDPFINILQTLTEFLPDGGERARR
jgi:uncharacterized protein YutE (UPF0331/DUF86 family)